MNVRTVRRMLAGPAGAIDCAIDEPSGAAIGTAVICHPHPQGGGTMDNKVVQTLARCALELGLRSVRFNFRGVGASQGTWSEGVGEVDDALCVIDAFCKGEARCVLAGFSFGAFVVSQAAAKLGPITAAQRLVLVGPSTQKQMMADVPADTVIIHGETDEVVPLSATLNWARTQSLPVIVFPGVGHFFHGQLGLLKRVVIQELTPFIHV